MSPRNPRRVLSLLALISVVGVFALASSFVSNAGAQPTVAPHVSLAVEMNDDGTTAVVTVMLDPGSEIVAALDGVISYNPLLATPTGCEDVGGFGACNPESAGLLRFASASTTDWLEPTSIFSVAFSVTEPSEVAVTLGATYAPTTEEIEATVSDPVMLGVVSTVAGSGAVTGTILAGDTALFGTQVCAESNQTGASVCADVDSRGSYRIEGLATGSYTMAARHYSGDYAVLTISDIAVVSPNLTQGVDGALVSGTASEEDAATDEETAPAAEASASPRAAGSAGTVSGTVTNAAGVPVPAALVCIEDRGIQRPSCAGTGFDGSYEINGLTAGNYVVSITDPGGRYGDQTGPSFGLNTGALREGIDFTLTAG